MVDPIFHQNFKGKKNRETRRNTMLRSTQAYFSNPTLDPESPIVCRSLVRSSGFRRFRSLPVKKQWFYYEIPFDDYSCGFSSGLKPDSLPLLGG